MSEIGDTETPKIETIELQEWIDSLEYVLQTQGPEGVQSLLRTFRVHAFPHGLRLRQSASRFHLAMVAQTAGITGDRWIRQE